MKRILVLLLLLVMAECSTTPDKNVHQSGDQSLKVIGSKSSMDTRNFEKMKETQRYKELSMYATSDMVYEVQATGDGSFVVHWQLHKRTGEVYVKSESKGSTLKDKVHTALLGFFLGLVLGVGLCIWLNMFKPKYTDLTRI